MERRQYERLPLSMDAKINQKYDAKLINVSKSGIRILSNLVPKNKNITISLLSSNISIPLKGSIQWSNKNNPRQNEMGILVNHAPFEYYQFLEDLFSFRKVNKGFFLWPFILITLSILILLLVIV